MRSGKKLQAVEDNGKRVGYIHWCPGCEELHFIRTANTGERGGPIWSFNGNEDKPTFAPSVLVWHPGPGGRKESVCHYFVREGRIQYLSDCHHKLAGQTVELEASPRAK